MYEFTPIKTKYINSQTSHWQGDPIFSQTWFWKAQYYISLSMDEEL